MIREILQNKSVDEGAQIKSKEICRLGYSKIIEDEKIKVEILSLNEISGGVEVFARAWKNKKQIGFGKDGLVDIERFRIFNPPILVDDVNGDIIGDYPHSVTKELKRRRLREDPIQALKNSLVHTIKIVGKENTKIIKNSIGNTTDTFYPVAGSNSPVDGIVARAGVNESWASIIAGAGTSFSNTDTSQSIFTFTTSTSNQFQNVVGLIWCFDTSTIGTDSISSATLSLSYSNEKGADIGKQELHITSANTGATNTLANSDYNSFGSTSFANIGYDTFTSIQYYDFSLNASGIANINKTGVSKFGGISNWHISGSFTGTWAATKFSYIGFYFADYTGTDRDPKLVIEHATGSAIKTINGLAKANVKTVNGLAIASVKTFNGLA